MAWSILLAGLTFATEWVRLPVPDVSWLLHVTERIAGGAVYGVDVVDVAPPPIIWYSFPAVRLGQWSGLGSWRAYLLLLAATGVLTLYLVRTIGHLHTAWRPGRRLVLLAASVLAIFVMPWGIFGEREHVALILVLPYILLFPVRDAGTRVPGRLGVAAGIAAGLGFVVKPHFAVPWAVLLLAAIWQRGMTAVVRRPETLAAIATSAGAALLTLVAEPGYVAYMRDFGGLYLQYMTRNPVFVALVGEWNSAIVVLIAVMATLVLWRAVPGEARPTVRYLLMAAAAFHLVAVLQLKGWRYHYLPGLGLSCILLLVLHAEARSPLRLAGQAYRAAALGTVVTLAGASALGNIARLRGAESATFDPSFESLLLVVKRHGGGRPIAVLSANLASAFPLAAEAGTGYATRYGGLPWLAAFYADQVRTGEVVHPRPFAARADLERRFGETVVADLVRSDPGLIIAPVPHRGASFAWLFDAFEYFGDVPGFQAFLQDYGQLGQVGPYIVLQHRAVALETAPPFAPPAPTPLSQGLPDGVERVLLAGVVAAVLLATLAGERRFRESPASRADQRHNSEPDAA